MPNFKVDVNSLEDSVDLSAIMSHLKISTFDESFYLHTSGWKMIQVLKDVAS